MFGGATISSYLFFGFLLVLCKAQNGKQKDVMCYDCNSKFDKRCADPFDPYSIGIVNCSLKLVPEHLLQSEVNPVLCRKIVQRTDLETRVIRGCGYIRDSHDDKKCYRRSGTSAVEAFYCSCTTSLCNAGESLRRPIFEIVLLTVLFELAITISIMDGILSL